MTDPIKQRLDALPESDLPADLWGRVRKARQRQQRRRRALVTGVAGMVLALPLAWWSLPGGGVHEDAAVPLAAAQDQPDR